MGTYFSIHNFLFAINTFNSLASIINCWIKKNVPLKIIILFLNLDIYLEQDGAPPQFRRSVRLFKEDKRKERAIFF